MRKRTWVEIGIAALGLFLVCASVEGMAQARLPEGREPSPGTIVASVIHSGRVRSVSQRELVLVDEGGDSTTLPLARDVRVVREGRRVALRSLEAGTHVRAVANMLTPGNPVTEIVVLPTQPAQSGSLIPESLWYSSTAKPSVIPET
jgi:hypothetical protein